MVLTTWKKRVNSLGDEKRVSWIKVGVHNRKRGKGEGA